MCVCVCGAADRTCSSLPRREQIVEFTGTWELLSSCLIRGAYASLNTEIASAEDICKLACLQASFFSLQVIHAISYGHIESVWKMGIRREEGGRS